MIQSAGISNSRHLSMAVVTQISSCDLNAVLHTAPKLLVWVALSLGPSAAPMDIPFLQRLLITAADKSGITTFEHASGICQRFVWSPRFNGPAENFWEKAWDTSSGGPSNVETLRLLLSPALFATSPIERLDLCGVCWREDCPASLYCNVCHKSSCLCLLKSAASRSGWTAFPENLQGMLWGAPLDRVLRICDIEWFSRG